MRAAHRDVAEFTLDATNEKSLLSSEGWDSFLMNLLPSTI
jgi:hypothetical protein